MWAIIAVSVFAALFTGTFSEEIPVSYLPPEIFETSLGGEINVRINLDLFRESIACLLRSPSGLEYDLNKESPEGVKVLQSDPISCGIELEVLAKEYNGVWTLEAEETILGVRAEKRILNFTVHIEEKVNAVPRGEAIAAVGTDFYLRLENPVGSNIKCHIEGPTAAADRVAPDTRQAENCAFVIRNAEESDSGTWNIVYEDVIAYKATVNLHVEGHAPALTEVPSLNLIRDGSIDQTIGPENSVYCTLEDPSGFIVYEGFGQCHLILDRVLLEHEGVWKMKTTSPGRVLTDDHEIQVTVSEADSKPSVTVTVEKQQPAVFLSCSVSTPYETKACKFRDPAGNILIASPGVGEDRYSFYGKGMSYSSGIYTHECGIQISSPVASDLGLWSCAIDADEETYFGFLTVLCPWAMADPVVASSVVTEPTLTADKSSVIALDGERVTLKCRVQTPIRYCYFRARNGTIFSVGPQTSTPTYSYSGSGLDAGECGVTFSSLYPSDSGAWSCHVGFQDTSLPEQRAAIAVDVQYPLTVTQTKESEVRVMITARAYQQRPLEYCRFVRIDGLGFTEDNLPNDYKAVNELDQGICRLRSRYPTTLDHHPWTVVAKIKGHSDEFSGVTDHTMEITEVTNPEEEEEKGNIIFFVQYGHHPLIIMMILLVLIPLIIAASCLINRRNREWTFNRTARARDSFRSLFRRDTYSFEERHNGGRIPEAIIIDKKEPLP